MKLNSISHRIVALAVGLFLAGCGTVATPAPQNTFATTIPATQETQAATVAATVAITLAPTQAVTIAATEVSTTAPTQAPTLTVTQAGTEAVMAATAAGTTASVAQSSQTTFVLADVGSTPTQSIKTFQPLADYLQAKLAPVGIKTVTIKVAPDFDTIAKWLKDGEVDMLFQTPYPAILLENAVGAKTILRRWRGAVPQYHTVIYARADSGVKTLDDLKGKVLAVQDKFSTSAYMLPLSYILSKGDKIMSLSDPSASVPSDTIGYAASNSDDNTIQWVISGKVTAGVSEQATFDAIPDATRSQLVILGTTGDVPRGVVMVTPKMDPVLLDALKSVLTSMDKSDDGLAVLKKTQNTAHIDELPGGPDAALAEARRLTKLLQDAVGN
ncbi:MAG TPA: phosphate/phosphite/phosphonate ABC transporter substrate-binding protein [Aggregatilineales bacterium]|nr:phosphate/phosphite/phosphonate ABC transporter substrate-binding protein [Aggregatilineales bacterium]